MSAQDDDYEPEYDDYAAIHFAAVEHMKEREQRSEGKQQRLLKAEEAERVAGAAFDAACAEKRRLEAAWIAATTALIAARKDLHSD